MENKIVYARQIPPDYQSSPLEYFDFPENIIVTGNRDFLEHTTPAYKNITNYLDDLLSVYMNLKARRTCHYSTLTEAANNYIPAEHKKQYSTRDIHYLKQLLNCYKNSNSRVSYSLLCGFLHFVTGEQYGYRTIRGYCQSDWNILYYPLSYSENFPRNFEIEYFNLGTEWTIHDEENAPESPENISGYCLYCYSNDEESIRAEIAKETNTTPENVKLFKFDKYISVAKYTEI